MPEQSNKETIRNSTLYTLVRQIGLTPQEVAQLHLSDLHLAGKSPNISFTPSGSYESKTVQLDLDAHRALVGWLVARPDSASDFLFPGRGAEAIDWQEIQLLVDLAEKSQKAGNEEKAPATEEPLVAPEKPKSSSPGGSRPTPPPSAPELGAPPPGMPGAKPPSFQPPPTAPEEGEAVNIPLPTTAPKPPPVRPSQPPEAFRPPQPSSIPVSPKVESGKAPPAAAPFSTPAQREMAKTGGKKPGPTSQPVKKTEGSTTRQASANQSDRLSRLFVPITAVVIILLCGGCIGGGWFFWQSETGSTLLAGLGMLEAASETFPEEKDILASLTPSAGTSLPTPTLPATSTSTLLPATNTPVPPPATDTPIPIDTPLPPTDTPVPADTDTPTPTDTPIPADTPTPESPADTPAPESPVDTPAPESPVDTPTPVDTPASVMKYEAPVLLEPEDGTEFIEGNIVTLRWQPVGPLAPDEQYAVRLIYQFESQTTYQGANVIETEWTLPASLYKQIDGPENLYEWFVVVERLNDDGSGTAVSPESEHQIFSWK